MLSLCSSPGGVTSESHRRDSYGDHTRSCRSRRRHSARLEHNESIKLHVFVDRSSVECFANDGNAFFPERIYPPPGSDGIELYPRVRAGAFVSLTIWELNSGLWK